jgi:ribosome-associated toxin RatA of RatAB toxin-antitoxin module
MYKLVTDVPHYGDFLPWCGGARFLEQDGNAVVAQVDIDFKGIKKSFTTDNVLVPGQEVYMKLREGPFSTLEGTWKFTDLGDNASKIELDLDFGFSNKIVGKVIGPVFSTIANSMVEAFHQQARTTYGERQI